MNISKKLKSITAVAAAAAIAVSMTACGKSEGGANGTADAKVRVEFKNTLVNFSENIDSHQWSDSFEYVGFRGDDLCLVQRYSGEDPNNPGTYIDDYTVYMSDIEGNIKSKTKIPLGSTEVITFCTVCDDGSIWYMKNSFDPETYVQSYTLCKMAEDGNVTITKPCSEFPEMKEMIDMGSFYPSSGKINEENNLCFSSEKNVFIITDDLQVTSIAIPEDIAYVNSFFKSNENKVYLTYDKTETDPEGKSVTKSYAVPVDPAAKALGTPIEVAYGIWNSMDGFGDYLYAAEETSSIYGYKADGTKDELFNLINIGVNTSFLRSSCFAAKGNDYIIIPGEDKENAFNHVRKLDESEVYEKKLISMAAYGIDSTVRNAIIAFNDTSDEYLIQVEDYSKYNDYSGDDASLYNAGLTKLNSEITSGNIADIISVYDTTSYTNFANKGLFADLNPYFDGENGINRDDYLNKIFESCEINDNLYAITTSVNLQGYACKKKYAPDGDSISFDQIKQVMSEHEGMKLFDDTWMTRENFISEALSTGWNSFISTDNTCDFDNDNFRNVLEIAKTYKPESENTGNDWMSYDDDFWNENQLQYRNDKTLLSNVWLGNYDSLKYTRDVTFGEEIALVGFPGSTGGLSVTPSSVISISEKSANKDIAWEFLKYVLSEENQMKLSYNIPIHKKALAKMASEAIARDNEIGSDGNPVGATTAYLGSIEVKLEPLSQADIDEVDAIINNSANVVFSGDVDSIKKIILEEADDFFNDKQDAATTSQMIQSRASLYLSEKQN